MTFQFCDDLVVSVHKPPVLKSGRQYDQISLPAISLLEPPTQGSPPSSSYSIASSHSPRSKLEPTKEESTTASPLLSLPLICVPKASTSHHALEVSVAKQQLSSFKTPPLNPQATSAKGVVIPKSNTVSSSSQQAAESIKKLYNLTFTDVQKAQNAKQLEAEEEKKEDKNKTAVKEETSKSSFSSFRRSFKLSPKGSKHGQQSTRPESSPKSAQNESKSPSRRKTISSSRPEKPKFFLQDILPVLQEKNQLKEQVHLLEDQIESLQRYTCST